MEDNEGTGFLIDDTKLVTVVAPLAIIAIIAIAIIYGAYSDEIDEENMELIDPSTVFGIKLGIGVVITFVLLFVVSKYARLRQKNAKDLFTKRFNYDHHQ